MDIQPVYISGYELYKLDRFMCVSRNFNVGERVYRCNLCNVAAYVTGLVSSSVYDPFEVLLLY